MRSLPILCLVAFSTLLEAETVTLVVNNRPNSSAEPARSKETITLEKGDLARVLYLSNDTYLDVTIDGVIVQVDANDPDQVNLPVVAGPATIQVLNFNSLNAALATLSIKKADEVAPSTPTQTVVIPDDGAGDREVRLESSTDLVTWTATQPGIFSSSQDSRFFRLRLVKTPPQNPEGE